MILTGDEIRRQVEHGSIMIDPFDPARCTTNSYDLALGHRYLVYQDEILDPRVQPTVHTHEIPAEGLLLRPGDFVLAETAERIGSDRYVPLIHAKSGTARMGLFVHVTADLFDIGFYGQSTLQLYATLPVRIRPGMLIAQTTFWVSHGSIRLYDGKYQASDGPQASRTYLDHQPRTVQHGRR
ncbi:dCTP deaminase [Paractinoplanes maris]|uniref:dCTP deaminase n=1 Tax=Paractinoplanes maris TaxID=1734446 RepID=UPI0020227008|nr:dCTP deaminase [Actinoplanes maris]